MSQSSCFDMIIVGGGMVGAAAVCALQDIYPRIALVDASPLDTSLDHRLIALNYNSISFLKNLTCWPKLVNYAAPINKIHVSQKSHFGSLRLDANHLKLPYLGYVIPAKYINTCLYEQFSKVTVFRPAQLTTLYKSTDYVELGLKLPNGNKVIQGNQILAADGTHSTVRALANISTEVIDYDQTALVTITELARPHLAVAYERFIKNGAIAMLPLLENKVATIWSGKTAYINELLQMEESLFIETLQSEFGYRLGKIKNIATRYSYPLKMLRAQKKVEDRIILIGNAAHTLHPIAAQGLNLALYEIALLRDHFLQKKGKADEEIFDLYQEQFSTKLSHYLTLVFNQDFFPINRLRELGFVAFDLFPPLKKYFLNNVLGRRKALPMLLREDYERRSI